MTVVYYGTVDNSGYFNVGTDSIPGEVNVYGTFINDFTVYPAGIAAQMTVGADGTLNIGCTPFIFEGDSYVLASTLYNYGSISIYGNLLVEGSVNNGDGLSDGDIQIYSTGYVMVGGVPFTNAPSGLFTNNYGSTVEIQSSASVVLSNGASVNNSGVMTVYGVIYCDGGGIDTGPVDGELDVYGTIVDEIGSSVSNGYFSIAIIENGGAIITPSASMPPGTYDSSYYTFI